MGVLTSFSVAKKITEEEVNNYFNKHKKKGKDEMEIGEMLREKIVNDINRAVENNEIPGIIPSEDVAKTLKMDPTVVKRMDELNRLIMIITHKVSEKKFDKMSLCYFINSLVNMLGLSEDDFAKFHRQNGPVDDNDNDEGDDDGEDGEFPV